MDDILEYLKTSQKPGTGNGLSGVTFLLCKTETEPALGRSLSRSRILGLILISIFYKNRSTSLVNLPSTTLLYKVGRGESFSNTVEYFSPQCTTILLLKGVK